MTAVWKPLPWHAAAWSRFADSVREKRLAHALLLAGPRGVGKRHFAAGVCGYLLCEAPSGPSGTNACGRCRGCVQFAAGYHPNFQRLAVEEGKRDIAIEAVRSLIERLGLSAHYGQRKLALFDPADSLNAAGINALLKTIEEPPRDSHLILLAERPASLPPTLRSRCQILRFPAPPPEQARAWLQAAHPQLPAERLVPYLRRPLELDESTVADAAERETALRQMFEDLRQGKLAPAFKSVERISKEDARIFAEWLLAEGAAGLRQSLGVPGARVSPLAALGRAQLPRFLDEAAESLGRLAGNANPQLLVESLMIRFVQQTQPLGR